jgi:hypothetical protein
MISSYIPGFIKTGSGIEKIFWGEGGVVHRESESKVIS